MMGSIGKILKEHFGNRIVLESEKRLTAYRVTMSDGSSYETSMAAGITLEEARAYFIGQPQEQPDEKTILTAAAVEAIETTA